MGCGQLVKAGKPVWCQMLCSTEKGCSRASGPSRLCTGWPHRLKGGLADPGWESLGYHGHQLTLGGKSNHQVNMFAQDMGRTSMEYTP